MQENENGAYVRLENGLQVCWHRTGSLGALSPGGVAEGEWTFPMPFSGVARAFATPYSANNVGNQRGATTFASSGDTSEEIGFSVWDGRSSGPALNAYANLLAIGRWK